MDQELRFRIEFSGSDTYLRRVLLNTLYYRPWHPGSCRTSSCGDRCNGDDMISAAPGWSMQGNLTYVVATLCRGTETCSVIGPCSEHRCFIRGGLRCPRKTPSFYCEIQLVGWRNVWIDHANDLRMEYHGILLARYSCTEHMRWRSLKGELVAFDAHFKARSLRTI